MQSITTPGVYTTEINAFPNSVVAVATAVPAFIGYTPRAEYEGKSYINKPVKITSFVDFETFFCYPALTGEAGPKHYAPAYYLVAQTGQPAAGDYVLIGGVYYAIVPDASTIYYLYNSVRLFYQNGGGDAYIVSVGTYGAPRKTPMQPGGQIINPNVLLTDLTNGLALLKNEFEPTMYICPEATLLSVEENATLMQAMLQLCGKTQSAISIFDIIGGRNPDPLAYTHDIATFRNNTGTNGLNYGAAYYPFVGTTIMQQTEIDYTNLFGGDVAQLLPILNPAVNPNPAAAAVLATIITPPAQPFTVQQNNNALLVASKDYETIIQHILADINVLPASGGMAGVITTTDNARGVWKAPANTSMVGVVDLPIHLSDTQQANLNIDAVSGKSINAIRVFNGVGILVWGARTLDGNSQDWKYLPLRRTLIFIEQSIKLGARSYVFEPNDSNTWVAVKGMISLFLTDIWKQGGLAGATPEEAFSVEIGLGETMTPNDILEGMMRISLKVAVAHPAEFIVLTFQQQQQQS